MGSRECLECRERPYPVMSVPALYYRELSMSQPGSSVSGRIYAGRRLNEPRVTSSPSREAGVGIITFNRPDRLNAMIPEMGAEVRQQLEAWKDDDSVGSVVLTGAGRAFCSGADISNFENQLSSPDSNSRDERDQWYLTLRAFPKPTIAAINGVAVGLGITCTLLCDIRLAATDARLSFRFVRLGLTPELGSTNTLPRLIGLERANEVMLTGRFFTGQEAREMGMVLEACPKEDVVGRAVELAQSIAEAPVWATV